MTNEELQAIKARWAGVTHWLPWLDRHGVLFADPIDGGGRPDEKDQRRLTDVALADPRMAQTWEAYRQAGTDVDGLIAEVERLRDLLGEVE